MEENLTRKNSFEEIKIRDYNGIIGKFHSHISIGAVSGSENLEPLAKFCRESVGSKITVIDLYTFDGRAQKDCMVTKYYFTKTPDEIYKLIKDLHKTAEAISLLGYKVLRIKLEHESLPTFQEFNKENYREIHIKMRIGKINYNKTMEFLKENSKKFGYVPSSNPMSIETETVHQFINIRYYDGDLYAVNNRVNVLTDFLRAHDIDVEEVKMETAVFDTNIDLDRWWACPCTTSCKSICTEINVK